MTKYRVELKPGNSYEGANKSVTINADRVTDSWSAVGGKAQKEGLTFFVDKEVVAFFRFDEIQGWYRIESLSN